MAVYQAKILMQLSFCAAVPTKPQTLFKLRDSLRPIVCCSGGQREVSQRLRLVQDLLLLIQPLKANLKRLRLLGIGLSQLAGEIVEGLAMIRAKLDYFSPLRDGPRPIPGVQ